MARTTFVASTGCTRTSETRHYTHAVTVDRREGEGRIVHTWSMSAANVAKAARAAERAGWKNTAIEEVTVQAKPVRTRKTTPAQAPAEARPAPAEKRTPLALYSVRPAAGDRFVVVNSSGIFMPGDWQTEVGAQERAEFLNLQENRKRAEDALTGPQRRVYAVVKRDGAIGAGYGHSLTAVRSLHAAGLVKLTEYGPGSWNAVHVPQPAGPAEAAPAAGTGVLPEDAEHPAAAAAVTALSGQPLADVTSPDDLGEVAGYWVRPDGTSGRLTVGWVVENGKLTTGADGRPPLAALRVAKELFERTEGWLVEPGDHPPLVVWHVPTLESAAAQGATAEQDRGAITDTWTITHTGLPESRSFLRVEAPDSDAAFAAAMAARSGRLAQQAGHRLSAWCLREADLDRIVGERVRHVASGQTGTVEAVNVRMAGARAYRDGVTVAVDGRSRKTARSLEWEPLLAAEDPEAAC
ncbi:hypothetical protein ACIP93_32535 [Streptomyces sp. NPDC088745]|uniref:hypothetical protein n=1 Tax=Streptomyces sp. NPDC088745 TaxID=3365884 RepID=UPI00382B8841